MSATLTPRLPSRPRPPPRRPAPRPVIAGARRRSRLVSKVGPFLLSISLGRACGLSLSCPPTLGPSGSFLSSLFLFRSSRGPLWGLSPDPARSARGAPPPPRRPLTVGAGAGRGGPLGVRAPSRARPLPPVKEGGPGSVCVDTNKRNDAPPARKEIGSDYRGPPWRVSRHGDTRASGPRTPSPPPTLETDER